MEHVVAYQFEDIPDQTVDIPLSVIAQLLDIHNFPENATLLLQGGKMKGNKGSLWVKNGTQHIAKWMYQTWAEAPHWFSFRQCAHYTSYHPQKTKTPTKATFTLKMFCGNVRCGDYDFSEIDSKPLILWQKRKKSVRFKLAVTLNAINDAKKKIGTRNDQGLIHTVESVFVACSVSDVSPCIHQGRVGMIVYCLAVPIGGALQSFVNVVHVQWTGCCIRFGNTPKRMEIKVILNRPCCS